jgi:hypothetical protein
MRRATRIYETTTSDATLPGQGCDILNAAILLAVDKGCSLNQDTPSEFLSIS